MIHHTGNLGDFMQVVIPSLIVQLKDILTVDRQEIRHDAV